jgi:LuxR family maltose regulon positive regulatory protein
LALVERGRRDAARTFVASWPGTVRGPDLERDLDQGLRTLDHALAASTALHSGRVEDLAAETRRALNAAPVSMPWVVFLVGSLLQACYRFTARSEMRVLAADILGRLGDRVDLPDLAVSARGLLGNVHMMHGALHRAMTHFDAALDLADAVGIRDDAASAMAWQFRGYVLFEWNRLDEAERCLLRAWELAGTSPGVGSGVARMMARVRSAADDEEGVDAWLGRLEAIVSEPMTLRNREWLAAARMGRTVGPGELRAVEAWLGTYDYHARTVATWDDALVLGRLHELDQVLALLELTSQWSAILELAPRVAAAARPERPWFAVRALSAQAVALEASGRADEADERWSEALDLGRVGAFVRVYVDGSVARVALGRRAASGPGAAEGRRVLAAVGERTGGPPVVLTPTQTEVLRRVTAGESNKTVARGLGVSVSTVKTHLRAVFERLGARSRTQAVARAREEGILD